MIWFFIFFWPLPVDELLICSQLTWLATSNHTVKLVCYVIYTKESRFCVFVYHINYMLISNCTFPDIFNQSLINSLFNFYLTETLTIATRNNHLSVIHSTPFILNTEMEKGKNVSIFYRKNLLLHSSSFSLPHNFT